MASKVEELRDVVMRNCGVENPWYGDPKAGAVDLLISAAHAEGVAEGKAEVIESIKALAQGTQWHDMLSVLAPTKEADNDK